MCGEPRGGDDGWLRVRVETPWLQRRLVACVCKGPVAEMTADGECVETLVADDGWRELPETPAAKPVDGRKRMQTPVVETTASRERVPRDNLTETAAVGNA